MLNVLNLLMSMILVSVSFQTNFGSLSLLIQYSHVAHHLTNNRMFIFLGTVAILLAITGLYLNDRNKITAFSMYTVFLTVHFLTVLTTLVIGHTIYRKLDLSIANHMEPTERISKNDERASQLIEIQQKFHCCGYVKGCSNWENNVAYGCSCIVKPSIDCIPLKDVKVESGEQNCTNGETTDGPIFSLDCKSAISNQISFRFQQFKIVPLVFTAIEFLQILVISVLLLKFSSLPKEQNEDIDDIVILNNPLTLYTERDGLLSTDQLEESRNTKDPSNDDEL